MIYSPCRNGLHVCGINATEDEFTTVANVPGVTERRFDELEAHYALPDDEEPDLVVDLMIDGSIIRDFGIRRQLLDHLIQSCAPKTTI